MPYSEHPVFQTRSNKKIWRYISIPQLLSIIEKNSLWFTRSDRFDDPYEGRLPKNQEILEDSSGIRLPEWAEIKQHMGRKNRGTANWEPVNEVSEIEAYRRISFVNSWHQQEEELDTLWRANLNTPFGAAIKSSTEKMKNSFSQCDQHDVYIGEVNYIDFDDDSIPERNRLYPFIYKRMGFSQENEIRAVVTSLPHKDHPEWKGRVPGERVSLEWNNQPPGMYIDIDVNMLVEEVRISPTTSDWVKDTLSDIISKYGLDIQIEYSSLAAGLGQYSMGRNDVY